MSDPLDLFVLVADLDALNTVNSLLKRSESLGIRSIQFDILKLNDHDSACFLQSADFLRRYLNTHKHALVLFDRAGCGKEDKSREEIESIVEDRLTCSGWPKENVSCIVFNPEVEIWVWSDSPEVAKILGWENRAELDQYLITEGFINKPLAKPAGPKEAMESVLKKTKIPRSAFLFSELASKVSLRRCNDPAFIKFKTVLQRWFPQNDNSQVS